jgi:arylsulfatase A
VSDQTTNPPATLPSVAQHPNQSLREKRLSSRFIMKPTIPHLALCRPLGWALVLALTLAGAVAAVANRPPNIVLIVSDDQGYDDLGVLNPEVITPNLDRLAREGVRLTSFYVAWPACTPSRGALLTGRYPQRNGVSDMIRNEAPDYGHQYDEAEYSVTFERIGGMDEREILLPAVLKQAGYVSGIFGKWDLGMHRRFLPPARGFDEFYGLVNTGIDYYTHERYGVPSMYRNNTPTTADKGTYCTYLFEREGVRFVKENQDRPFFLYLPFNAPHGASSLDPDIRSAAQAPDKYLQMYPHLNDEMNEVNHRYAGRVKVAGPELRRKRYLGAVTCMDEAIGSVLNLLDEYKLAEDTIVIFFSDNGGGGGSSNRPLRGGKSTLWEGGNRVCAIVRYPGRIPAGTTNHEFLSALEVFPTLLKAAGLKPPGGVELDGFDMMPVLAGKASSQRTEMFWKRAREGRAARVGDWKWVDSRRGGGLFDLSKDIGEKNDLSAAHPQKLAELKAAFAAWEKRMEAAEPRGPFRDY